MATPRSVYSTYEFQYPKMTDEEVWDFLWNSGQAHSIYLTTVDEELVPHCTAIAVRERDGKLIFNAFKKPLKKKIRNIMKNPNVCLTAAVTPDGDGGQVYGICIVGTARVIEDPELIEELEDRTNRQMRGRRPSTSYAQIMADQEHSWVEITPTKLLSWDKRKRAQLLDRQGR